MLLLLVICRQQNMITVSSFDFAGGQCPARLSAVGRCAKLSLLSVETPLVL
jgi:hypothetical protein